MPAATVTIRELKNKDTGIDLTIPTYKEIKGMLGSNYEYHVMVVSNLSYFKSAKHKKSDNVQFMIPKKFTDFEELYTKMNMKYSGTAFPPLPKKVLLVTDAVTKERRGGLEYLLKFLASTPKVCTCPLLLEFLGVSATKAGRMKKMEVSDKIVAEHDKEQKQEEQSILGTETQEQEQSENLFDDEERDEDDFDMFAGATSSRDDVTADTKIFDELNLGGAINEGDEDDLFLADAKLESAHATNRQMDTEDNSDLFQIDDDLDKIMMLNLKPKSEPVDVSIEQPERIETDDTEEIKPLLPEKGPVEPVQPEHIKTDDTEEIKSSLREKSPEEPVQPEHIKTDDTEEIKSSLPEKSPEEPVQPEHIETDDTEEIKSSLPEKSPDRPKIKAKPVIKKKPVPKEIIDTNIEMDFDAIAVQAANLEVASGRPKPAPRKKPVAKDRTHVPKRPEIAQDKPDVPKKPEVVKEKPSVPKRPEIARTRPDVPKRPEGSVKTKLAEKPKLPANSNSDETSVLETIQDENDILKYIQENTANEDNVDLFS